ncbi:hypothetical protein BRC84_05525 [Halobacteriales archaeon QS_1_68_44]|nr:MAG: hypothetical protein BRC84_05525 [Halobacteriales archaeon QS_1_68_44]
MDAIGIERGDDEPRLLEVSRPAPGVGEVLVRTLRVGIDGTDHEVIAGNHSAPPAGGNELDILLRLQAEEP